jgi:hypothetical protein
MKVLSEYDFNGEPVQIVYTQTFSKVVVYMQSPSGRIQLSQVDDESSDLDESLEVALITASASLLKLAKGVDDL